MLFSIFGFYQLMIYFVFQNKTSMGLAQLGRCSLYGYDYNVLEISLSNSSSTQSFTTPILFNGPSYSCIGDEHIQNCDILRTNLILQLPLNLFEKYFRPSNYYYDDSGYIKDPAILNLLAMLGLVLHYICSLAAFASTFSNSTTTYIFARQMYSPVISGILLTYGILYTTSDFHLLHIENCEDIVLISEEALTICHSIAACGLTIVSLNYIARSSLYGYITMSRLLAYYIGLTMLLYFVFLLVCDVACIIANRCEAHRQSIIGKRGGERDVALETAPVWFVNEYLPPKHWQYVSNSLLSKRYGKFEISHFTTYIPPLFHPCLTPPFSPDSSTFQQWTVCCRVHTTLTIRACGSGGHTACRSQWPRCRGR